MLLVNVKFFSPVLTFYSFQTFIEAYSVYFAVCRWPVGGCDVTNISWLRRADSGRKVTELEVDLQSKYLLQGLAMADISLIWPCTCTHVYCVTSYSRVDAVFVVTCHGYWIRPSKGETDIASIRYLHFFTQNLQPFYGTEC